jgi:polysaccharide biosynthesis/export protein
MRRIIDCVGLVVTWGWSLGFVLAQNGQLSTNFPAPASKVQVVSPSVGIAAGTVLQPGLSVDVTVMVAGKKEFEEKQKRVSDSGHLTLPLVGRILVRNLTMNELSSLLTTAYGEYFVQPQVLVEYALDTHTEGVSPWGYVVVLGRVRNPGRVEVPPTRDLTVTAAIQKAGGLDTSAKANAIRVTRALPSGTTRQIEIDLRRLGSEGNLSDDFVLVGGDIVYVPEMIF